LRRAGGGIERINFVNFAPLYAATSLAARVFAQQYPQADNRKDFSNIPTPSGFLHKRESSLLLSFAHEVTALLLYVYRTHF
jgi:hypothetical protein